MVLSSRKRSTARAAPPSADQRADPERTDERITVGTLTASPGVGLGLAAPIETSLLPERAPT